jgi:serine/threonine protein kinase
LLAQGNVDEKTDEFNKAEEKSKFLKSMIIEDLVVLSVLGQGAFGRVKLAQHKTTGETFALKCQSKKAIVRNRIEDTVINEMRLMRMLNHERIGKLYCALQDTRNIYFVLELLQGGEFFTYLQKVGRLSEAKAVFYAASVVSAFTALHEKKIAYRDLKPENMVLDAKGFVKIVDLGLAKQILDGKTWTMCGTPDYLAPEIILNEGHDYSVDYWALGVLIYEMVTGWPPFYADEPMKTYEKIVACSISFPVYITRQMSDVVSKLLATQPGRRLGNLKGGINDIMKHKWFGSFDWAGLDDLSIAAPYVPSIKSATDVSNFESYDDEKLPDECSWVADLS